MLTETLVPLLSLTSKKGLVTIASKIYIFAHMLMPVSVFPHQGWHISRRKASLFVCTNSIYCKQKSSTKGRKVEGDFS